MKCIDYDKGLVEVNRKDGCDVAELMASFVNSFGCDAKGFIEKMSNEHKTLQQSFTRLCWQWILKLNEMGEQGRYDDRNKASVEFAQKVVSMLGDEARFPFV